MSAATAPARDVVVDAAGARMGGAARYLEELRHYLERSRRADVTVIGVGRGLGPGWLLRREAGRCLHQADRRRVALNNVGFCAPGGERWTLLRNALHFLTETERDRFGPGLPGSLGRETATVRLTAGRSDVLVTPSTAMADRVSAALPGVAGRIVVRPHPLTPGPPAEVPRGPAVFCPVLPAPYKDLAGRLADLLTAFASHGGADLRLWVTAEHGELPAAITHHPRVRLLGRLTPEAARRWQARSRALYFPSGLESFGYPLAEARAVGLPVIAVASAQNREVAGPALCGYTPGEDASLLAALEQALTIQTAPDPAPFDPDAYFAWLLGGTAVTRMDIRPYCPGDSPAPRGVQVSVVVLTLNEEVNIRRCLASVAWADQVVVVDCGSTDETVPLAKTLGAEVVEQPWLGFSAQREFALRLPLLRHDWVYFVDADQWVCPQLAGEVAQRLRAPGCAAFAHRFRLVFLGTWIRHCGWYAGSWNVQLMDRRRASYNGSPFGERVHVDGTTERLRHDIVDDDMKGFAAWLEKHIRYAGLEAGRRGKTPPLRQRLAAVAAATASCRPVVRTVLKEVVFPAIPAKPVATFFYMYVVRLGVLDGRAGLRFCFYHAWFQASVSTMRMGAAQARDGSALR